MSTFQTLALSFAVFNVLIIWFLKKASNYFRKMDKAVGNIELNKRSAIPNGAKPYKNAVTGWGVSIPIKKGEILYEQAESVDNGKNNNNSRTVFVENFHQ